MRKEINVNEGVFDIAARVSSMKSINGTQRKKLINDCLYYERKLLKLLRRLQAISEGVEDLELQRIMKDAEAIGKEIEGIEKSLKD